MDSDFCGSLTTDVVDSFVRYSQEIRSKIYVGTRYCTGWSNRFVMYWKVCADVYVYLLLVEGKFPYDMTHACIL